MTQSYFGSILLLLPWVWLCKIARNSRWIFESIKCLDGIELFDKMLSKSNSFFFKLTLGHLVIFCFFNADRNFYYEFNQIVIDNCIWNINRRIPTIWYTLLRFHCKIDINCYERFIRWIIERFNGNSGSLDSDKKQIFSFRIFNKLLSTQKSGECSKIAKKVQKMHEEKTDR